jgi:LuxR family maltose regulon positive regulatory protein
VLLADADELEAKLRLSLGDPQGARRAAELLRSPRQHVVDAIIALAAGEVDAAEQALDKLVGTELTVRTEVELQLLRANVAVLRSASDTAQVVRRALDNAQRHGFVQTVLDTAPQLLDHVVANPHLYPHSNDLGRLLAAHLDAQKASGARPRRSPLIEPLTTAEMRVLSRLSEHLSNSEIASELYVSLNTVKTHVKHIYLKLDVNTRSEALSRAAALGLVR